MTHTHHPMGVVYDIIIIKMSHYIYSDENYALGRVSRSPVYPRSQSVVFR